MAVKIGKKRMDLCRKCGSIPDIVRVGDNKTSYIFAAQNADGKLRIIIKPALQYKAQLEFGTRSAESNAKK